MVTNRRKTRHSDRIVASYCLGTRRLYDFVDDNPLLAFLPIDRVCELIAITPSAETVDAAYDPRKERIRVASYATDDLFDLHFVKRGMGGGLYSKNTQEGD